MPSRTGHWLQVTGRLKPGVPLTQAQAELDAVGARLARAFPAENDGWVIRTVPLQRLIVGDARSPLLVLLGAVGLVLLIACANISNLLLARATSRSREMAVRATLGAGRARIVRQLLSETAVLGLLGGLLGIALAWWGVQSLSALLPPSVPRVNEIRVDRSVLGFALLLSAIASGSFGLAPALLGASSNLHESLREGGARSGEPRGRRRARGLLVAAEVALATVLLVAAGLLLRSFSNLVSVSPGFDVRHVVKADISLPRFQYQTRQQWASFSDELLSRIQAEPGLQDSALAVPRPIADRCITPGIRQRGPPCVVQRVEDGGVRFGQPGLLSGDGDSACGGTRLRPPRHLVFAACLGHQPGLGAAVLPESGSRGEATPIRFPARGWRRGARNRRSRG